MVVQRNVKNKSEMLGVNLMSLHPFFPYEFKGKNLQSIQSALVYGSEIWAMKVNDMRRLEKAWNTMLRLMCDVTLTDRKQTAELGYLRVVSVEEMVSHAQLRSWKRSLHSTCSHRVCEM